MVIVVALSFVLSRVYNGSGGSVLLAILWHNGLTWALYTAGTLYGSEVASNGSAAIDSAVLALLVLILTRGRLGLAWLDCRWWGGRQRGGRVPLSWGLVERT